MQKRKMRRRKARLRQGLVCISAIAVMVALIAALATALTAKSPETDATTETLSPSPMASMASAQALPVSYAASPEVSVIEVEPEPEPESLGEFVLTAYCPCVHCCGEWSAEHPSRIGTDYIQKTASGTIPTAGRTIGVDPSVIPFGTTVIINGHEYVAEDRGGAIKGNKIDIFFSDHAEALDFGRQTAEVFIKTIKED